MNWENFYAVNGFKAMLDGFNRWSQRYNKLSILYAQSCPPYLPHHRTDYQKKLSKLLAILESRTGILYERFTYIQQCTHEEIENALRNNYVYFTCEHCQPKDSDFSGKVALIDFKVEAIYMCSHCNNALTSDVDIISNQIIGCIHN